MAKIVWVILLVFGLAGCATMKKSTASTRDLQMRIDDLEGKLQEKDDEIRTLEAKLGGVRRAEGEAAV